MRNFVLILLTAIVWAPFSNTQAQTLTLSMPDTTVAPGSTINLPMSCRGFDEIVSMQFSISWDTTVIVYQDTEKGQLDNVAVGDFQAGSGVLRVSWFDVEGMGQTLPDGTVITYLQFLARGAEGDSTPVSFVDSPLQIQIHRAGENPGEFIEVEFNPEHGLVKLANPSGISVAEIPTNVSCAGAADGQIELNITYDDEFSVSWTGPDFTSSETTITDLGPGTYNLRISDTDDNPLYESAIEITEPEAITVTSLETQSASCISGLGSASLSLTGGMAPITYDIGNGPGDLSQLEELNPGAYALIITDANGCTTSSSFSIAGPTPPDVDLGSTRVICPGETTTLTPGTYETYNWSTGSTSPVIALSNPGTYSVTVTDQQGCQGSDEILVQFPDDLPEVDLGPAVALCPGEMATLDGGTYNSYLWSTGETTQVIQVGEPGTYRLTVTNSSGCEGTGSIQVQTGGEITPPDLGPDLEICPGQSVTLSAGAYVTYNWSTGASSQTLVVSEPGTYGLTVTNAGGCEASDVVVIRSEGEPINLDLGPDTQLCAGETLSLSAGSFSTYNWSTGSTAANIVVSEPGTYALTVTNANGCETSDAIAVTAGEEVQLLVENDFLDLCPGESIELLVSGAESYVWTDTSNSLSALDIANPMASPDTTAGYRVIGSSACGSDTVDLEVYVYQTMAMAGPDTCIGPGTEAQLMAFGGVSYFWESNRYPVSDPTSPMPTASPEDSTTYLVAITDFQGCVVRDSVLVLVANDPEGAITAVNMITPNGDEKNDVLYFPNISKFGQNSLKVFNRWGNVIYQKVNYQSDDERFDGTYNGQQLPAGTYYYLLSFRSGEIKQKLTILR
ncbi:T9SS type B sorting domain-containing protein [Flavilitoribacter nigricans]|uniref:Cohesin domain-containing protein n=1 Tax=Flavilitoribacter nigricans (strain ATCC 23147 / DSM 23189 / NBRC 102662 / NCIMB 1420 / SS-2) TaxID=1122177 RepID=A0A2D0NFZ0_FLAN2|nr:gliding motility-associated C-terminal domain-containing protein [Flavilitoribacter nigricans]PHN07411.1 hypothetical protein CRP01_07215 [Flavilitoribacter nigricans DSM 23189 = NBRC 102662]